MIRLAQVQKRFDRPVLTGVDLKVPEGCLYGLVGPGASGKTVLLKVLCGLLQPDAGHVEVDSRALSSLSESELLNHQRRVGMLFQNNALFDSMTVADNVAFPLRRLFALSEPEVQDRVSERLGRVGLSGFEARMPSGLSGGQKKRVGIARATITRAPILLYDEPAAGLDPVTSQRIFDLLRAEQRASNATVVMVSSDIDRLLSVTDRVAMLHRGRMVFDGSTEEARQTADPLVRQFMDGGLEGPL